MQRKDIVALLVFMPFTWWLLATAEGPPPEMRLGLGIWMLGICWGWVASLVGRDK